MGCLASNVIHHTSHDVSISSMGWHADVPVLRVRAIRLPSLGGTTATVPSAIHATAFRIQPVGPDDVFYSTALVPHPLALWADKSGRGAC